jgi:hypothetical protein
MPSRRSAVAALVAVSALVAVAPAGAAKPAREPLPAEGFVDDAGIICGFPIAIDIAQNKETLTTFSDGNFLITGVFKATFTNVADPSRTITVNASAASRTGETSTGPQLYILADPEEAFGAGIYLVRGKSAAVRDEEGRIVEVPLNGTVSGNLCDLIASP